MERIIKCPVCKKSCLFSELNPFRPFCSERCRLIDLGKWFEEDYHVLTDDDNELDNIDS